MSPRPAFALALATAVAGASATSPLPAGAVEPELIERCYVEGLTVEEVEAGEESDVWCVEVEADAPLARRGTMVLAILYQGYYSSGASLYLEGTSCNGLAVNWAPGHEWNDKVSSTDLVVCGSAKHYQDASFGGTSLNLVGLGQHSLGGTALDNATSSIKYAP